LAFFQSEWISILANWISASIPQQGGYSLHSLGEPQMDENDNAKHSNAQDEKNNKRTF